MFSASGSHKRNNSMPVGRLDCHSTASSNISAASLQKSRGKKQRTSSQNSPVPVPPPLTSAEVPFDPKSILPLSKPQKSLSKLLEASLSASKRSSQSYSFTCIDGTTRTFNPPPLNTPPTAHESKPSTPSVLPEDQYLSTNDDARPREVFTAFGIEAFPTRAVLNEVCYDFVSYRRWCSHGSHCNRIHPLQRSIYLPAAIQESVQKMRSQQEQRRRQHGLPDLLNAVNPQHLSSQDPLCEANQHKIADPQPRVNLPQTLKSTRGPDHPSCTHQTSHHAKTKESDTYSWNTTEEIRQPPWAGHASSDTSSSSNDSDDGISMWEIHTDARDWEAPPEEIEISYGRPTSPKLTSKWSPIILNPTNAAVLRWTHQNQPLPVNIPPTTMRYSHPKNKQRCQRWLRNDCELGYDCNFVHDDLDYDLEEPLEQPRAPELPQASEISKVTPINTGGKRRPRPNTREICKKWLRDECYFGYDCRYVHGDLDYDDDESEPPKQDALKGAIQAHLLSTPERTIVKRAPERFTFTLHGHMKMRVGPGFDIEEFTTGFESQWVYVGNLPKELTNRRLTGVLQRFGEILDVRRPPQVAHPLTVRVQFSKPSEAYKAFSSLHGAFEFGRKLELRMAIETKDGGSLIQDTTVRIDWEAPHRNVYMGYPSMVIANEVAAKASRIPYDDFVPHAAVHVGLPAVGSVTVKFSGVPVNVTEERMEELYGPHQGMVSERPNYNDISVEDTIKGVKKMLLPFKSKILDVEFRPPPYKDGKMRAWVNLSTPNDAQAVAENLYGRKPIFTGHTRIIARHVKSIKFAVSIVKYRKIATNIKALAEQIWRQGNGYTLAISDKTSFISLILSGEDLQVLRRLKVEVERTINGEILLEQGVVAWDDFLGRPSGFQYLQEMEHTYPGFSIERDPSRRSIRLFGIAEVRAIVREKILEKIAQMRNRKTYSIVLEGRLANALHESDYQRLQEQLGVENVMLDLWNRLLRVRGDKEAYTIAQDAVASARMKHQSLNSALPSGDECPVCFNDPSNPFRLPCGHSWCQGCLQRYFTAAIDQKFFPLTCLGNEGKCKERIPLITARGLVSAGELEAIVNAAFSVYVQTNPTEFHYCPTPDCSQVYRTAPEGVSIQCPSCLVRICPHCHTNSHDGLTCQENKHGDELFQSWAGQHNVKQCPGCKISIEKDEGCNHMVCTMCKTHICWVCLNTFPNGDGIYAHMRSEHGDFGLGPIL